MKSILNGINWRLDIVREKISEPEDTEIKTNQIKHTEKQRIKKLNRALVSWGTTLSSITHM